MENTSDTYSTNDPKQRGQRTIFHAPEFFQLLACEFLEDRISPYDCLKGNVWNRSCPGLNSAALRRDSVGAWDGDRACELPFQLRKCAPKKSREKLVRHGKATEASMHRAPLRVEWLRRSCRDCPRTRDGRAPRSVLTVVTRHTGSRHRGP